jgi:hypothetical protein
MHTPDLGGFTIPTPQLCSPLADVMSRSNPACYVVQAKRGYRGQPVANVNTKAWNAALLSAGIENFKWHDLRHTFAT